jgi:phage-related protein
MFEVEFYEDKRGNQPVRDVLTELRDKAVTSKNARIQYQNGTRIGEPQVKHIDGNLWELCPLSHRIFFFYWKDNKYILLHHFIKKTQRTPPQEIEKARQNMRDYLERNN